MLSKKEKKEYVFGRLNEVLLPQGYELFPTGGAPNYILNQDEIVVHFSFNFLDIGDIAFSKVCISIKKVEEIVFEIKKPNQNYDTVDNKRDFLLTIIDKKTLYPPGYREWGGYPIRSGEDLEVFTDWILHYLENEGKTFIEKYSYLPNILAEMNRLEAEGKYWHNILSGSEENLFRALIISKLCNDIKYNEKLLFVQTAISDEGLDDLMPYYEKLKERLKSVEPIYNV